jgi:hypothetical protein
MILNRYTLCRCSEFITKVVPNAKWIVHEGRSDGKIIGFITTPNLDFKLHIIATVPTPLALVALPIFLRIVAYKPNTINHEVITASRPEIPNYYGLHASGWPERNDIPYKNQNPKN